MRVAGRRVVNYRSVWADAGCGSDMNQLVSSLRRYDVLLAPGPPFWLRSRPLYCRDKITGRSGNWVDRTAGRGLERTL